MDKIKQIEKILGAKQDGKWDDKDQAALDKLIKPDIRKQPAAPPTQQPTPSPDQMASAMPTTYAG